MADEFKIVASLNIEKSTGVIKDDIKKFQDQIKNEKVKIVAGLDIAKSKNLIQSQLNTLANQAKAPAIKVGVDTSGLNSLQGATQNITNSLQTVQTQAQQTASAVREVTNSVSYEISDNAFNRLLKDMQIGKNVTDEYKASIRTLANQLNESWNTYNLDKYNQALNGLINKLDSGQARMRSFTSDNAELTRVTEELKVYQASIGSFSNKENRLKFYIDPKFKEELVYVLGSIKEVKSALNSMYGVGNWTFNPNKQIEGFQNLVNYIDKSDAGLSHFGKTLFETFSQAQAGGNNFAGFFADVVNKVRTLRDTLNFKATPISEILSSTDTATATRAIEDMIAKAINLNNYEERNRDVFRGFYEEVTTDSVVMTNDLNNVATAAQNVQRAMTPSDKNYFSNSSAILRNIQYFNEEENAVRSLEQTFTSLGATVTSIERKNSSGFLDAFTVSVRSASGEVENFNYRWKNLNAGIEGADPDWKYALSNITATDKYIQKLAESAKIAQDKLNAMADTMHQKLLSTYMGFGNGSKPIVNAEHWNELAKQADVAGNAIERLRTADSTTSASIKANADIEIQKLKDLARSYQNAEYAATSLRNKDIGTIKTNQTNELNEFIAQVNRSKVPVDTMTKDIEELKIALNGIGDKDSLTKFLNQFDNAKSKFESVKATYQSIADKIKELQRIQNSGTFNKNSSDSTVINLKQQIATLLTEYERLKTQLNGNVTPQGLTDIGNKLTQLNTQFNDATTKAEQFETKLKSNNGAEQLAQKVALLTSRIKAYRQANSKSEKKFGSQYDSMLSQLANPNIDLNTYNALNKQFQTMRQEINAANVAGKNLWQTLKEKLGKFTGWMSMTYAVSMFTRSIRQAVTELKEIDTILTEISKTSDRTEASLRKLGETSFATASKYGQKASDYLLGVQEMSRAGFDENSSEQMAELSTLAQSAGDMTAELANEYLIATNAGYKLGGSAEKLNAVLNSQNYITNRNALNMSELAEATKIVASQASQSGIGIDKMTAAVGTMIATTQQGGEVAARAFKGILMNLQQVKGTAEDIGDGGEDITTESLTKYEKACADLGVSLKEVKDGVLQLRDPMVILEELANAVSKEAEGSIKVANLINAVGGKFCLVT